jgi:class 3 adenylate cyclase
MQCSSCNHDNEPGRNFCAECGKPLPLNCPACGARNSPNVKFCGACGAALSTLGSTLPGAAAQATLLNAARPESFVGGRYKVVRLLGEGSSKTVFLAHDNKIDRDVAFALIKTLGLDAAGRERISREARAMGQLGDNPYIVSIYDVGEERGQPYIVSQFMAGGSVDDLLRRSENHRLAPADAMRIACDVCRALDYAHSRGIIHRDLKPANVWLTADGITKLGDFGLAIASDRTRLTAAGMIVGTAAYLPPEQALGKPLDARSDLYSLGAMLYELVTGQPPFHGDDLIAVIAQHVNAQPETPSKKVVGIPPELDALVLALLAKNPDQRPRDAAAVRTRLEAIMTPAATTIDDVAASVVMERPNLQAHAAPDGTVSILFSDIENSTVMTEQLGDLRAQEVLREHNDLVRRQVAEQKGFEVKSMGDGFMVAFSSARRALLCAIGIQRAIAEYSRLHPTQPIRVRIGLHMGEAISEGGDFFGKSVIMAARIAAKARAGEILVSSVFKAVTDSAGDIQFDEGYDVELKGLTGTYRVHRVIWSDEDQLVAPHRDEPARPTLHGVARQTTEEPTQARRAERESREERRARRDREERESREERRARRDREERESREERRARHDRERDEPRRRRRPLVIVGVIAAFVLTRIFFERVTHESRHRVEAPAAQPQTVAQSAPASAPPLTATGTQAAGAPSILINAPGISPEQREKALAVVSAWLNMVDAGHYPKAWEQSTFIIPKEQWVENQKTLRARRGLTISRKLESEELNPGRNPNRMLFRYATQYENGKPVIESVFVIPRPNGEWVVAGYFVKMEPDASATP